MITRELELERKYKDGQIERTFYELTEMCPCELVRYNKKMAIEEVNLNCLRFLQKINFFCS